MAINPEGFPYPQHICGFRCLMPIVCHPRHKTTSTDEHQWQCWGIAKLLCILAVLGWYKQLLFQHHVPIDPQPSWQGHVFHDNVGEAECIWLLTKRPYFTVDKADDCHDFAYT